MKRVALFIVVLALACLAFKCDKSAATFNGSMSDKVVRVTPKGVSVHSAKSISDAQISAVDAGLDRLFTIAQESPNNYRPCPGPVPCFNTFASYIIWLLPRSPLCVNPGFTEVVYSDPWPNGYDETYTDDPANHWDKDPRAGSTLLCVAGFMTRKGATVYDPGMPGMGVVDDVGQLATIVRYEGEHNVLLEVDPPRYAATQYHYGANGGHPILGDGNSFAQGKTLDVKPFEADVPGYGKVHALITR
jgi:hypothetical protein